MLLVVIFNTGKGEAGVCFCKTSMQGGFFNQGVKLGNTNP